MSERASLVLFDAEATSAGREGRGFQQNGGVLATLVVRLLGCPQLHGEDSRSSVSVRGQKIRTTREASKIPASQTPPLNANHNAKARRTENRLVSRAKYTAWWDS